VVNKFEEQLYGSGWMIQNPISGVAKIQKSGFHSTWPLLLIQTNAFSALKAFHSDSLRTHQSIDIAVIAVRQTWISSFRPTLRKKENSQSLWPPSFLLSQQPDNAINFSSFVAVNTFHNGCSVVGGRWKEKGRRCEREFTKSIINSDNNRRRYSLRLDAGVQVIYAKNDLSEFYTVFYI
jgi:hypothetical protein